MSELVEQLVGVCGPDRVSDALADRICYTRDCGPSPGGIPYVIVNGILVIDLGGHTGALPGQVL